jgi:pyruvate/2-oxoglutarate dehydrogenase complex dihydrolipoamide dehydrogenase (E3) component
MDEVQADVCVIGAGSGGLTVAAGAALLGVRTVLIEKGRMGGDCLNYGCVPSKALLAAGHAAEAVRRAGRFGVGTTGPAIDGARVYARVREVIAAIAPNDSAERFEGLGATVIPAAARFVGPDAVEAGGRRVRARRFVVATGSSPAVPPVPGLGGTPFLTNETVFDLNAVPGHLVVVGGGPIGIEMAQAHRRLGARVTVLEMARILPRDEPELVEVLHALLRREGIDIREGVKVAAVERDGPGVAVTVEEADGSRRIEGTHLLVAAGRRPNVDGLGLEAAGVAFGPRGIQVDSRLRTTNRRIYAVGDVAGPFPFTHTAAYQAGIVIRNALFRWPAKVDYRAVPWVTYTAPELAQVGLTEAQARAAGHAVRVLRWSFAENDRAQAEGETEGQVKLVVDPRGRLLGAAILGAHAGELIQSLGLAVARRLKVGALAQAIVPYPTLGEVGKRAAGTFFAPKLFGERTKRLVRFLMRFG